MFSSRKILLILPIIALVSVLIYYKAPPKIEPGNCATSKDDGYIWYVANYSSREYTLLGWQTVGWGNPVKMEKDVLERNTLSDKTSLYFISECPQYGDVEYTIIEKPTL